MLQQEAVAFASQTLVFGNVGCKKIKKIDISSRRLSPVAVISLSALTGPVKSAEGPQVLALFFKNPLNQF